MERLHDDVAEIGIVGSILLNPEYVIKTEYLKPKMFYNRENASVLYSIQQLNIKGVIEIDNFSLINYIESHIAVKKTFTDVGIHDVGEFIEDAKLVARSDFNEYCILVERVMTLAFKREAEEKLSSLMNECKVDDNKTLNEVNYRIQDAISGMAENYLFDNEVQLMSEVIDEVWESIKSKRNSNGISGIPSKYSSINKYFTYEDGELIVIGGRAKGGKSMFFANEIHHKLENGLTVAVFDTEMSTARWLERFLAIITKLKIKDIRNGNYSDEDEIKINQAIQWIKDGKLIHKYDTNWTKDKIYTRAKQIQIRHGLDFLVFDYIKADETGNMKVQEHNYLGDMTNFLKNKVAGGLQIPVLAGGQMSPNSERLADSDKINRYASVIAYWKHKTPEEIAKDGRDEGDHRLYIDYNRLGGQMTEGQYLNFVFNGDYASIEMAKIFYHTNEEMPY